MPRRGPDMAELQKIADRNNAYKLVNFIKHLRQVVGWYAFRCGTYYLR